MGIFFWIHSVALVEDLNLEEEYTGDNAYDNLMNDMEKSYQQVCYLTFLYSDHSVMGVLILHVMGYSKSFEISQHFQFYFSERNELLDCSSALPCYTLCFRTAVLDEQPFHL